VLEGHVEVFADGVVIPDDGEDFCREAGGIGIVETYPAHAGKGSELFQKQGELALSIAVQAVEGEVLGDETDFFDAFGQEALGFGEDVFQRARNMGPPHEGDSTEGAFTVTPFGDFEVGVVAVSATRTLSQEITAQVPLQGFYELLKRPMREKPIYLWQLRSEGVGVAVDEAAYHIQGFDLAGFLSVYVVEDSLHRLALGPVNEAARIQNNDVGGLKLGRMGEGIAAIQGSS